MGNFYGGIFNVNEYGINFYCLNREAHGEEHKNTFIFTDPNTRKDHVNFNKYFKEENKKINMFMIKRFAIGHVPYDKNPDESLFVDKKLGKLCINCLETIAEPRIMQGLLYLRHFNKPGQDYVDYLVHNGYLYLSEDCIAEMQQTLSENNTKPVTARMVNIQKTIIKTAAHGLRTIKCYANRALYLETESLSKQNCNMILYQKVVETEKKMIYHYMDRELFVEHVDSSETLKKIEYESII